MADGQDGSGRHEVDLIISDSDLIATREGRVWKRNSRTGLWKEWSNTSRSGRYKIARAVLTVFTGPAPLPPNNCALHKDDNTYNNTPENLYWGNQKQNIDDAVKNGSRERKIFPSDITEMIKMYKSGKTYAVIAASYSVDPTTVKGVLKGLVEPRRESWGKYEFTQEEIDDIRRLNLSGESQASIAKKYGISQPMINKIVNGKRNADL